jgi:NADPH2:quinone reductase
MKAIRVHEFGGPQVMRVDEVPEPAPSATQVRVAVKAAGVNPVETYIRAGAYARKPALPYTPGSDAAGIVDAVGSDVKHVKVGDRVYTGGAVSGTYAEKALCDAASVYPLPERVSFGQGAGISVPYGTAYRALMRIAKAQPHETVLVHGGSGGVGTAATQIGRAAGLHVIATAGTDRGRTLVREQGAHAALDHHAADFNDRVLDATGGKGPDIILEMLANVNLDRDLKIIGMRGRIVVIGNRGAIEINPRDAMGKDATIHGMTLFNVGPEEMTLIHAALHAGFENGSLRPVVGQEFKLAEAAKAHDAVMQAGAFGKIVLVP